MRSTCLQTVPPKPNFTGGKLEKNNPEAQKAIHFCWETVELQEARCALPAVAGKRALRFSNKWSAVEQAHKARTRPNHLA